MKTEIARQQTNTAKVWAHFQARPLQWIPARELATVAGFCAWRTRVSDARDLAKKDGGDIVWNQKVRDSAYRFVPYVPLARSAEQIVEQKALF